MSGYHVNYILNAPRPLKRLFTLLFDFAAIFGSILLAFLSVSKIQQLNSASFFISSILVLAVSVGLFIKLGFYRAILRYMGVQAISVLLLGVAASAVVFSITFYIQSGELNLGLSAFYWCFLTLSVSGSRLIFRALVESRQSLRKNVAIYGAGGAGRQLASALAQGGDYRPVVFFDDDPTIFRSEINGLTVLPPIDIENVITRNRVSHVLLAMPNASHKRRREILSFLEPHPVKVKTIAGLEDIVSGRVNIEELKDLDIEDLLGRDSVDPDPKLIAANIKNKVVMVTGAGGSIGSELCRQILTHTPKVLVLYELTEFALYSIDKEIRELVRETESSVSVVSLLGSVQNKNRLIKAMSHYKVQTVYHAAAYKHVPIVENNVVEGIRNNVFGTWYCAEAAIEARVEKFVLISTDKAVRPTNIMGASKRLAELVLQGISLRGETTVFSMVRFGNVLGSSGSVVPLFRKQIKEGGPVTVTHKDIIRYFMTIPEAAQLVLQAGAMGKGGDVFVLDMGEPVKIAQLAKKMVHLLGKTVKSKDNPNGEIEIQYSGLRPGEKLYEELLIGDNVVGTEHPRIMMAMEECLVWDEMRRVLETLDKACSNLDLELISELLLSTPTGYNPTHEMCDLLKAPQLPDAENNVISLNPTQP